MSNIVLSPRPIPAMPHRVSRHLLLGTATIAIAAAALSGPAAAQSFQGTPTVTVGGATVNTGPGSTTININAPVTVINWRPNDTTGSGVIAFQPAGTTAVFQSANSPNFTVLNRILPVDANAGAVTTRAVRFDGAVSSQFGVGSGVTAGSIWFYTPGGIILGSTSAFNVGSLVLSTSDISPASIFVGNNGTIDFTGTPNPNSAITLENGARVNALINGSSYVAMVAPRIVQNGRIEVDGSAALVAAEAVDITMDGGTGLFDIAVTTGTSDANGIVHGATGSTTGPASSGTGDPQRIYMMAIPKNAAISMLVNGNIGYTPAATATVQNGEVVLSAGYSIANGNVDLGEHALPVNGAQADITIGETSNLSTGFTSRVIARSSGRLRASPGTAINGTSFLSFSGSAFLLGDLAAIVETNNSLEVVGVGGNLNVSSRRAGQGGEAAVRTFGGLIGVGGDLTVDASSIGFSGQPSGIALSNPVGGDGVAGAASIVVTDGNLRITGTTRVVARGVGGYGTATAGNGVGGVASVDLSGANSQSRLDGGLEVQAEGYGISSYLSLFGVNFDPPEGIAGGKGRGGSATVNIGDVALLALPGLIINASGVGDKGGASPIIGGASGGAGGVGIGGTASLSLNNEALILPDLTVEASGFGGGGGRSNDAANAAGNGGAGMGGNAQINLSGLASLNLSTSTSGGMTAIANGNGGAGGAMISGSALDSGSGGAATGGTANISIAGSSQVAIDAILALADATTGAVGDSGTHFGGTGAAQGGIASLSINSNSTVAADILTASASTSTHLTSRTGSANGGIASIDIQNGAVTVDEIIVRADTVIDIEKGQNVSSANAMLAGDGTGGNASLSVSGGLLTVNSAGITANGQAMGQNPDGKATIDETSAIEGQLAGGNGRGGNATFTIGGGSANVTGSMLIEASGKGGDGFINSSAFATQPTNAGRGGEGVGGQARLSIFGGILTTPTVDLRSDGLGGNGGAFWGAGAMNAGNGGSGQGGTAEFRAVQDVFFVNTLTLSATGRGGVGGTSAVPFIFEGTLIGYGNGSAAGGSGGSGRGGRAALEIDFDPAIASVLLDASGFGGAGGLGFSGGQGGNGSGGAEEGQGAQVELNFGDLSVDTLVLRSNGTGGNGGRGTGALGGAGGNGAGGDASILARGANSNLITLDVLVQANAVGGNAGATGGMMNGTVGGIAIGGNARINIINSATADLGATRLESLAGGGTGGSTLFIGEGGGGGSLVSGIGGTATGGRASLSVDLGSATSTEIFVSADAQGGNSVFGGTGGQATGGNVAVTAFTGSIDANNATLTADARGGNAAASTGGNANVLARGGNISFNTTKASANAETAIGIGGFVSVRTDADSFGTSGSLTLGDTSLASDGLGGFGGGVSIDNNNNNTTGGIIQFGQLLASAEGIAPGNVAGGIAVRANQSDILVAGDVDFFTSDGIKIDSIGEGTFAAVGNISAGALTDIVITHTGQPGLVDTVRGNIVSFFARRNFDAQTGSIIRATNLADVQSRNGFVNVDQLFAVNTSNIEAGIDATLRNAAIINGSLNMSAGRILSDPPKWQSATATVQGAVTVSDQLVVNSGGDVVINGGAAIRAGNDVVLNSGDDIIIRNSTISSAQNVTTTGQIRLNAGAITPINPVSGEVRSIVIANSALKSTGHDLNVAADAIDATSATINANRFTALVNNAPASGVAGGNDNGLLAANCVQGNICLGAISTPTQILVGPATGNVGLANRVTMAGSLASTNVEIRARDAVAFTGPMSITATNNLLVSVLNGPIDLTGAVTVRGDNGLSLYAGAGAIAAPNTALVSNGNIGLFASGVVSLGSVDTGGVLNTVNSDGSVATAGSLMTPGNVTVAGQLAVRGGAANINSGGAITTGSILTTMGNDVLLSSTSAQSLGTMNSGRDIVVNAASLTALSVTAARDVTAVISGNATLGTTTGSAVALRAGQNATFNSSVVATGAIDVRANGEAMFRSVVNAPNITVRSGNIVIESEGQIGVIGTTQNVTLNNSAGVQMTIGGSGVLAGYSLSSAEITRVFANDINLGWSANLATTGGAVSAPTGGFGQPTVIIDALTLTSRAGSSLGNLAANGNLNVSTTETMRVMGAVALNGAGTSNNIRLNADQSLQIISGQGSVAIRDGANGLAGSLVLNSASIIAASNAAIADVTAQTDAASINTRLGNTDGNVSDIGILSADRVDLNGGSSVFVQNSGAGTVPDDRRGITANAINVSLTSATGLIVINGKITAAPSFATGLATIPLLSVNGTPSQTATGFNALSTMNGCQIAVSTSCNQQPENPKSISVTDDDINRPLDPDSGFGTEFPVTLIELKEFETFGYPPLIDEPVTGSGNDDLWPATCPVDDETCKAASATPVGN